ncbi:MAG: hypothetical protein II849_00795 [Bacteroidales bacterium]|nr:hypothetical protein [Bacteroidales bacterium]
MAGAERRPAVGPLPDDRRRAGPRGAAGALEWRAESGERRVESGRWKAWIAAACVAAVVLPLALHGAADDDGIRTVKVDGEQVLFACNTGCSPDGTIETLKTYLQ